MTSFHDEVTFPGGMRFEDHLGVERTDFSVEGSGTGKDRNPVTLVLHITTGNATVAVCNIEMKEMERLGKWLIAVAKEKLEDSKKLG